MRRLLIALLVAPLCGCGSVFGPKDEGGTIPLANDARPINGPVIREWKMRPLPRDQANFLILGDWGCSNKDQRMVARAAAEYVAGTGLQFNGVLTTGDNMYEKLPGGVRDKLFQTIFEDAYDAERLNFPFYMTLGNHDYDFDTIKHVLQYPREYPQSRWKLPAKWYRLDLPEGNPLVTALMLESDRNKVTRGEWAKETAWLEEELSRPRKAPWLLCVAHHSLFSNGPHEDNAVLQIEWGPMVKEADVDFYIGAHDHDLQHLQINGWRTTFVLSGGGGREQKPEHRDDRGPFSRVLFGFAHMQFFADRVVARYISAKDGQIVHEFIRWRDGRVEVVSTTPSDKPSRKQLYTGVFDESEKETPHLPSASPDPAPHEK